MELLSRIGYIEGSDAWLEELVGADNAGKMGCRLGQDGSREDLIMVKVLRCWQRRKCPKSNPHTIPVFDSPP